MPKKVLIVSRYFWPDKTPESLILYSIANFLKSKGHSIDILSSQPSYRQNYKSLKRPYKEIDKGVRIFRLNLTNEIGKNFIWRIINALRLSFKTISLSLINKYEVIVSTSNPPILGPASGACSSLLINARFVYYCMDIMPEVGTISGDFTNPLIFQILRKIDVLSCFIANPLIVHSVDMKNTFMKRKSGYKFKYEIINNFSVKSKSQENLNSLLDLKISQNKLTVLYAGNIGRFQSLENVIKGMTKIKKDKDIELIIMGEGVQKDFLIKLSKRLKTNIRFIPYQDPLTAKRIINQVDIGLISLSKGIYKYAYPSKTMSYLEQGKPVIAIVEKQSQIAKDIQSGNFGYIISEDIENCLPNLLKKLKYSRKELDKKKSSVLNNYEKLFSSEVILNKWDSIIGK